MNVLDYCHHRQRLLCQAPMAERPIALPPVTRERCYANHSLSQSISIRQASGVSRLRHCHAARTRDARQPISQHPSHDFHMWLRSCERSDDCRSGI